MSFLNTLKACALAVLIGGAASVAEAATVDVSFNFIDSQERSVGGGSFSYDKGKSGVIGYGDLNSFSLNLVKSYDLDFVNGSGGSFSSWWGFSFDTESLHFVSQEVKGYSFIMAALVDTFDNGFFIRDDDAFTLARDYPLGDAYFARVDMSVTESGDVAAAPLPAPIAMLLVGLAALGFVGGRRRRGAAAAA